MAALMALMLSSAPGSAPWSVADISSRGRPMGDQRAKRFAHDGPEEERGSDESKSRHRSFGEFFGDNLRVRSKYPSFSWNFRCVLTKCTDFFFLLLLHFFISTQQYE